MASVTVAEEVEHEVAVERQEEEVEVVVHPEAEVELAQKEDRKS